MDRPATLHRRRRAASLSAVAGLITVLLSGCGLLDTGGSGPDGVLTSEQLDRALITRKDVGKGYRKARPDPAGVGDSLGCLDAVDKLALVFADAQREVELEPRTAGRPLVAHIVRSFGTSEDYVAERFVEVRDLLVGCHRVSEETKDRLTFKASVSTGAEKYARVIDEQLNVFARGTVSGSRGSVPFEVAVAAMRIRNNISLVMVVDPGADAAGRTLRTCAKRAALRLARVMGVEASPDARGRS